MSLPDSLPVPAQPDAWTLRIVRRGGLEGKVADDFTIDSEGTLSCTVGELPCIGKIAEPGLSQLRIAIRTLSERSWIFSGPSVFAGACAECFVTLMQLQIRQADSTIVTSTAFWDLMTHKRIHADLVDVYRAASNIRFLPL